MKRFNLLPDETVLIETGIHWKNYLSSILLFVLCSVLFTIRAINPKDCIANAILKGGISSPEVIAFGAKIELVFFAFAILWLFGRIAKVACIRYYITDKRILVTTGFFTIHISEMLIARCETVTHIQSVYERLFRCADVYCYAPGSVLCLEDVPNAEGVRETILQLISQNRNGN